MQDLSECDLRAVPAELAALPCLADCNLRSNYSLGRGGDEAFEHLAAATALTRLILGGFTLHHLPPQLSALAQLRHLVSPTARRAPCFTAQHLQQPRGAQPRACTSC